MKRILARTDNMQIFFFRSRMRVHTFRARKCVISPEKNLTFHFFFAWLLRIKRTTLVLFVREFWLPGASEGEERLLPADGGRWSCRDRVRIAITWLRLDDAVFAHQRATRGYMLWTWNIIGMNLLRLTRYQSWQGKKNLLGFREKRIFIVYISLAA